MELLVRPFGMAMASTGLRDRSYLVTHLQRHEQTAWTADPAEHVQLLHPGRRRGVADRRHPGTLPHGLPDGPARFMRRARISSTMPRLSALGAVWLPVISLDITQVGIRVEAKCASDPAALDVATAFQIQQIVPCRLVHDAMTPLM